MGVTIALPLFGNPGRELEEGATVHGRTLRELARNLGERLAHAADVLDRLAAEGWTTQAAQFDVLLHHSQVHDREEALRRLRALGIDPEGLVILEDVEEDED